MKKKLYNFKEKMKDNLRNIENNFKISIAANKSGAILRACREEMSIRQVYQCDDGSNSGNAAA